jgi:hypothetical protein
MPWDVPVEEVQTYFGEQVAMYFAFLAHFTRWLWFPTIVGLAAFIHQEAVGKLSISWLSALGVSMTLWSTGFIESWKRRQIDWACHWGTSGTHSLLLMLLLLMSLLLMSLLLMSLLLMLVLLMLLLLILVLVLVLLMSLLLMLMLPMLLLLMSLLLMLVLLMLLLLMLVLLLLQPHPSPCLPHTSLCADDRYPGIGVALPCLTCLSAIVAAVSDFESEEELRIEFCSNVETKQARSLVSGKSEFSFSNSVRLRRMIVSFVRTASLLFVLLLLRSH